MSALMLTPGIPLYRLGEALRSDKFAIELTPFLARNILVRWLLVFGGTGNGIPLHRPMPISRAGH